MEEYFISIGSTALQAAINKIISMLYDYGTASGLLLWAPGTDSLRHLSDIRLITSILFNALGGAVDRFFRRKVLMVTV